jgi:predicted SPOUT superfamily RNA methylase MTH1
MRYLLSCLYDGALSNQAKRNASQSEAPMPQRCLTESLPCCSTIAHQPQYIETPQYLRKQLVPMHPDLKFAGLLSPLDAPHHVRADEWSAYREGVVVNRPASQPARNGDNGSYVYIGTKKEVSDYI